MVDGEPLARASEAGLHLVGDEQDAVLVGEAAQLGEEPGARRVVAALTLDRLDQEGGDLSRADLVGEQRVQFVDGAGRGFLRRHLPLERPGVRGDEHRPDQRVVALPVLGLRGGVGDRAHRPPMEAAPEDDHALATGDLAGQLHRGLHRLGARVDEDELVDALGCDLPESLTGAHQAVVAEHHARVPHPVQLVDDRLLHRRRLVTEVGDRDPGGEVEQPSAVRCRHPRPLGARRSRCRCRSR